MRVLASVLIICLPTWALAQAKVGPSLKKPGFTVLPAPVYTTAAPAIAAPAAQEAGPAPGDETGIQELQRMRERTAKSLEAINASNPLAGAISAAPSAQGPSEQGPSEQGPSTENAAQVESINRILANPIVRSYLRLFTEASFQASIMRIIQSPQRANLLLWELLAFIGVMIIRAWRTSRARSWMGRLAVSLLCNALLVTLTAIVVPRLVLGDDYFQAVRGLASAMPSISNFQKQ